jgi:hypothetical protein
MRADFDLRLVGLDLGFVAAHRGVGVIDSLLRHRADGQELVIAVRVYLVVLVGGLVLAEHAESIVELRLVVGRVDLEQHLARLDVGALRVVTFNEHA